MNDRLALRLENTALRVELVSAKLDTLIAILVARIERAKREREREEREGK